MLRPWPADDGLLVRLRLVGGRVRSAQLRALIDVAESFGDGRIHVTSRANLQVRGFPEVNGRLSPDALTAVDATGLLPSRTHDLVRNIMLSPQSGLAGGRADLRGLAADLDRLLCADPALAGLPGKFLFVLDDGRGDLLTQRCDLGLVALDAETAQIRVGSGWGPPIPLRYAAARLCELAHLFQRMRGDGPTAAWRVDELDQALVEPSRPDRRLPSPIGPLAYGDVAAGIHHPVPESGLDRTEVDRLTRDAPEVIVTPWRGVLVPTEQADG